MRMYPYEDMNSWERFIEKRLLDKRMFYSKLNDNHAHNRQRVCAHAEGLGGVWMHNTGQLPQSIEKTDILLLADVFKNFGNLCQEQYILDPAHYFTSPGLSSDALLKPAWAVQGNAFWYKAVMAWNEYSLKQGAWDLQNAYQQNFTFPIWFKAMHSR